MLDRFSIIWLALIGSTVAAYAVGHDGPPDRTLAAFAVLAIAGIKARLVIRHFMEIRLAPTIWRRVTDAWIAICVVSVLVVHYWDRWHPSGLH